MWVSVVCVALGLGVGVALRVVIGRRLRRGRAPDDRSYLEKLAAGLRGYDPDDDDR